MIVTGVHLPPHDHFHYLGMVESVHKMHHFLKKKSQSSLLRIKLSFTIKFFL